MDNLHLLRPYWALALLVLPGLHWWLKYRYGQQVNWKQLVPKHLQAAMLIGADAQPQQQRRWPWWLAALMVIILSGPTWVKQEVPLYELKSGRVLLLDMSYSMYATDIAPNRLTQARYKAIDLIRQFDEGETALVAFAGDAFALAPLTDDKATLLNLVPTLSPEIMPVPGSDLPSALALADTLLKDAGYQKGEIILVTDGMVAEHADTAIEQAASMPWTLKVYGLGTEAGAPMRRGDGELVKSRAGDVVVAQTDFRLLNKLAQAGNGELVRYRTDDGDVVQLAKLGIDRQQSQSKSDQASELWQDIGIYLLPILLLPIAWLLRKQLPLMLVVILLLPSSDLQAAWWQSDRAKAVELLENQQYQQAAELLPQGAQKGHALYRSGDFKGALSQYQQDQADAQGLYNQGNALAKSGDLEGALAAYEKALAQQPEFEDAQFNHDLVKSLLQQQQQQQQQDESSDQQQDQQGDSQQPSEDQQGQSQQDQQSESADEDQSDNQQDQQSDAEPQQSEPKQPDSSQASQQQAEPQEPNVDDTESQAEPAEPEPGEQQGETQAQEAQLTDDTNPDGQPIDPKLLQRIQDDPSILLRNKMKLEYERRRRQGKVNEELTQW